MDMSSAIRNLSIDCFVFSKKNLRLHPYRIRFKQLVILINVVLYMLLEFDIEWIRKQVIFSHFEETNHLVEISCLVKFSVRSFY